MHPLEIYYGKQPQHPGAKPKDPQDLRAWQKKADRFAEWYLIMFRPETSLYEEGQECTLDYSWDTFVEFVEGLRRSKRAIDRSRLELMERMAGTRHIGYE